MTAPHSLCIAIPRLYRRRPTPRNRPDLHRPVIPVSSTFEIRRGVYRNFVRERRRRCSTTRRPSRDRRG